MTSDVQKGKLKSWNDDKGFGFIAPEDGRKDIFIHISALKRMGRRPTVGDVVIYQVHTGNDGKIRAVNGKIEGLVEVKAKPYRKNKKKQSRNGWFSKVLSVALVLFLGIIALNTFLAHNDSQEKSTASVFDNTSKRESGEDFKCAGKVYCSEMTSCDEAKFYQRNCPGTKMDGDGDGIPCESQWCSW